MARGVKETGQRGGKAGQNTTPMAACSVCCPSKAPLPLWSLAPPGELPAPGCTNPAVLRQAQHHCPHQQELICRPGCAGRKHNYHQACLAGLGSRSGGCWALITPAAAFPDGLGSKGCWLSALGHPSAWLEPLQLDPAVLGELGLAHPATMDQRASKCGQVLLSSRSPLCWQHQEEAPG